MKKAILYIESELSNALLAGGLQANLQGFQFLRESTFEVIKCPELLHELTKKLYPMIGKAHNVNAAVVERSMRHAIDVAYRSQSIYGLNDLLQTPFFTTNDKPCNGCLIALIAEIVKKNMFHVVATTDLNSNTDAALLAKDIQEFIDTYYGEASA